MVKNGSHPVTSMGGLVSSYVVGHLTSYPVNLSITPDIVKDANNRLKSLEKKNQLWAHDFLLKVDEFGVELAAEADRISEKIPLNQVKSVKQGFPLEKYKEILLILVKEGSNYELQCLSCVDCYARDVAEDIESAIADSKQKKSNNYIRPGTLSRQRQRRELEGGTFDIIPPPPAVPPPALPVSDSVKQKIDRIRQTAIYHHPEFETNGNDSADYNALFQYRVDRNVLILNHCLDDIEAFAGQLQKAAEAHKQLSVKSKKSKSSSTGSLSRSIYSQRARPPPKEAYLDIFAKQKFCFNLLGELQGHIQNPSAEELCHYLFKPLKMIIASCGGPTLAQGVLTPLHTEKALRLLRENMNSSEAELFFSLGEKWTRSQESWANQNEIEEYHPEFNSGWMAPPVKPPPQEIPEIAPEMTQTEIILFNCRVTRDFQGRNEMELSVLIDDVVHILDDNRLWWYCRMENGQKGYLPSKILSRINHRKPSTVTSEPSDIAPESPNFTGSGFLIPGFAASSSYAPSYAPPSESVNSPTPPPMSPPPPAPVPPPPVAAAPTPPPPPAPAPVPVASTPRATPVQKTVTAAAILARKEQLSKPATPPPKKEEERLVVDDEFKDELDNRVKNSNVNRQFKLPSRTKSIPSATITKKSAPREVKRWLQSCSFSHITVESLGDLNGSQIFSLTKDELRQICDHEGNVVYSKLKIQENLNQQKGTFSTKELQAILSKRRQMTHDSENQPQPITTGAASSQF